MPRALRLHRRHPISGHSETAHCYKAGTEQPHALLATITTGSCTDATTEHAYDAAGNTTKRPDGSTTQNLDWNEEGKLSPLTEDPNGAARATDYLYGADGNLLIRRNTSSAGETVLYLGATEVHLKAGKTWANRYYSHAGSTVALRSNETGTEKITYLSGDHHGTSTIAITSDTQALTKRYQTPFGAERGSSAGNWPDDKGFLGKTADTDTGLTHIGAREYDPIIGQFISVDPVLAPELPQTLNGYSYAGNNPVTFSDPTGLRLDDGTGHSEPIPDSRGNVPKGTGVPRGGTGPGGCYYNCGAPSQNPTEVGYDEAVQNEVRAVQLLIYGAVAEYADSTKQYKAWLDGYRKDLQRYRSLDSNGAMATAVNVCYVHEDIGCSQDLKNYFYDVELARVARAGLYEDTGPRLGQLLKPGSPVKKALSGCKCFLADTDVLMADGTTKDIEDIEVGDKVEATDPETGETGARTVTRRIVTTDDKKFNVLSIATEDGVERLTATHEHPFWSPSEDAWVTAGDLAPGMTLLTDDGDTVIVTGNRAYTSHATTYNLTVDELHTYYVLAGQTPVLVHNANCGPGTKFDVPTEPGVYSIHLKDGTTYVGSSTTSIRERVNKSMRSKHAVRKAGYTADDIANVTYFTLPSGTSKTAIRRMEQTMMEGVKARGGTLLDRRDPEIDVPIGGYLP